MTDAKGPFHGFIDTWAEMSRMREHAWRWRAAHPGQRVGADDRHSRARRRPGHPL